LPADIPLVEAVQRQRLLGFERLVWFVGAVVALACAFLAAHAGGAAEAVHPSRSLVAFALVTLTLQALSVNAYGRGSISVSGIGLLAIGFVFGVGPAMVVALLAAAVHALRRRPMVHKILFNAALFVLSTGAAAGIWSLLGGNGSSLAAQFVYAQVAAVVFLVVNVGLISFAMAIDESLSPIAVWNERLRWMTLHYLSFGPLALGVVVAYKRVGIAGVIAFALPPLLTMLSVRLYLTRTREAVERLRDANAELVAANERLSAMTEQIRKTHRDTIAALSRSMEAKDLYTGGHTERVAVIAVALAEQLGFTGEELAAIEIAALLHDIGKIGIPEHILHKPGPLDDDEWAVMRQHPLMSDSILSTVELHPFVREAARWSHERLDGGGYPDGLSGDEIPLPARIVLVADAFDAITTDRPYRRGQSTAVALAEIGRNAGTQFCPLVVAALERAASEREDVFPVGELAASL
jgi:hypothetical protein